MRVSVLIAAYNAEAYVAEAVDSVLSQSRAPDEVIVVDDGSTDCTRAILEGFGNGVVCLSRPNRGQAAALNGALATATGDLLAFCDADDLWTPRKLELQMALLQTSREIEAVFGRVRQFVSPEIPAEQQERLRPATEVLHGELKQCMLIRRSVFDNLGPFEESLPATFFIEWLGRAKQRGLGCAAVDDIVALRRLHLPMVDGSIRSRRISIHCLRCDRSSAGGAFSLEIDVAPHSSDEKSEQARIFRVADFRWSHQVRHTKRHHDPSCCVTNHERVDLKPEGHRVFGSQPVAFRFGHPRVDIEFKYTCTSRQEWNDTQFHQARRLLR